MQWFHSNSWNIVVDKLSVSKNAACTLYSNWCCDSHFHKIQLKYTNSTACVPWTRCIYRILFPVFIRTHCGIGLFCFCFRPSLRLMINVLWAACNTQRNAEDNKISKYTVPQKNFTLFWWYMMIFTPHLIKEQSILLTVFVCLRVCLSLIIYSQLHTQSLPIFVHFTYGNSLVLLSRRSDMIHISGLWMMPHMHIREGCSTLPHSSGAPHTQLLAWLLTARRNTRCGQRMHGTPCSHSLQGHSGHVEYSSHHVWI